MMKSQPLKNAPLLFILLFLFTACSGGGSGSSTGNTGGTSEHPANYLLQHAAEASSNLSSCRSCHGTDYAGLGDAVSCQGCHVYAPTFDVHISAYSDPALHGAAARTAQIECLGCHGMLPNVFDGGILSDPNIFNIPEANCSATGCHPDATAHPTNWQGDNDSGASYVSSHRSISAQIMNESCVLCHKVDGPGAGPNNRAPSCWVDSHENSNMIITGCHPLGP